MDEAAEVAFKGSKIRDESGKLLKVYLGTESEDFYEFDKARRGQTDTSMYGRGYYFAFDPDYSSDFGDNIREFYLDIKNPFYIDINAPSEVIAEFLESKGVEVNISDRNKQSHYFAKMFGSQKFTDTLVDLGYDGVVVRTDEGDYWETVAFHRNQMKLADAVTYDDDGNVIPVSERFGEKKDVRYSFDEGELNYSNHSSDEVLKSFGIVKNNDYIHVQKQVLNTLKSEGFFEDTENNRTVVTNDNSGMKIEINRKGINETFNEANYKHIPKELKYIKLLTIRDVDKIIKSAHLVEDNAENYHNNNNGVKYAYFENVVNVDGVNRVISIAVRKSIRKNMFWVHQVDIKKDTQSLSARVNHSKTDYLTSGVDNNISYHEADVNKKYSFGEEELHYTIYTKDTSAERNSIIKNVVLMQKLNFSTLTLHFSFWCRWRDLNPHGIATNGF